MILDLYLYLVINSSAAGEDHWCHPVSPLWIVCLLAFAFQFISHICDSYLYAAFYLNHIFVSYIYMLYLYQVQSHSRRRSLKASCLHLGLGECSTLHWDQVSVPVFYFALTTAISKVRGLQCQFALGMLNNTSKGSQKYFFEKCQNSIVLWIIVCICARSIIGNADILRKQISMQSYKFWVWAFCV